MDYVYTTQFPPLGPPTLVQCYAPGWPTLHKLPSVSLHTMSINKDQPEVPKHSVRPWHLQIRLPL